MLREFTSMNDISFQDSGWYEGLTLRERLTSFRPQQQNIGAIALPDEVLARERLQRWKSQHPFATDSYFSQRLAMDNIDEGVLLQILGEPAAAVQRRCSGPPQWLAQLSHAFVTQDTPAPLLLPDSCGLGR